MDFKKIKNLFVVSDGEPQNKKSAQIETKTEKKQKNIQIVDATKSSQNSSSGIKQQVAPQTQAKVNEKILTSLSKAIQDADLPGEDYLEYIEAVHSLKDLPLTEELKYKTAYTTLSTKGLTIQKIYESADYYIKILENERTKFYEALKQRSNSVVKQNKDQIAQLTAANKEKATLIQKLTAEIQGSQQKIAKMQKESTEAESKLKSTEMDFLATCKFMTDKIISNIEKVKQIN